MYEFGARVLLAGAIILTAGITEAMSFPLALGVAIMVGVLAVGGYVSDSHGLYEGTVAEFHAGLEGLGLALLLTDAELAQSFGFAVLAPFIWIVARRGGSWPMGGFCGAFALVAAYGLIHRSEPPLNVLLPAVGIFLLGLGLSIPALQEAPLAEVTVVPEDAEIKGRFRALREAYSTLEQRSKHDGDVAALARATTPQALAQAIRNATGALGAALFVPADERWELYGSAGIVPSELMVSGTSRGLQAQGATLLFAAGRAVGAVWTPEESRDGLAGLSEVLASRIGDRLDVDVERKRRNKAEMRAALVEGGGSPEAVAQALAASIGADSVEFGVVGSLGTTPIGRFGSPCGLPQAMRHETGLGLTGWAAAGAPIVWIGDARSDGRLDEAAALRARTATLGLVSLANGRAYVWAAWHSAGVGRPSAISAMREAEPVVTRWLTQAVGR